MKQKVRLDRINWSINADTPAEQEALGFSKRFTLDANGFLSGKAAVTNVGVFEYVMADGSILRELRCPEEVFNPDSLKSLCMLPLTNDHPTALVDPTNSKELQVGSLGDGIETDAYHIWAPIVITDAQAIADVQDGKRALSCGYSCELEMASGTWMGIDYDAIQRDIRYNHVAIVARGRAGDAATMRLDSASVGVQLHPQQHKDTSMLITFKLDAKSVKEHQADAEVIDALNATRERADAAELKLDKAQADADSVKERLDSVTSELAETKAKLDSSIQPEAIEALVAARLDLHAAALKAGVEVKSDSKESDVKIAIIQKVFPKANLDGKSDAYVAARYDAAIEQLDSEAEADAANSQGETASDNGSGEAPEAPINADAARLRMVQSNQDAYKRS